MNNIYITADDFGLTRSVSDGIIYCAQNGLIDGTALLVNAPDTDYAIEQVSKIKNVEVGLHLSLVEGFCLSKNSSLIDSNCYFPGDKPCLYLNWKSFAADYLKGKIKLRDLRAEFEKQIEVFQERVGKIPFINGTQHLHMLPGILEIVLELCDKYQIPKIRTSGISAQELMFSHQKILGSTMLNLCSLNAKRLLKKHAVVSMGKTFGITVSGRTDSKFIDFLLSQSMKTAIELVIHPGYENEDLKTLLPENYAHFDWPKELESLHYLKEKQNVP